MRLHKIGFGSYVKIFSLGGLGMGLLIGLFIFVVALFGGPATATIGSQVYGGITAGLIGLLVGPLTCGIVFAWFPVLMYPFSGLH